MLHHTLHIALSATLAALLSASPVTAQSATPGRDSETDTDTQSQRTPKVPPNYPLPPEAAPFFAGVMSQLQELRSLEFKTIDIPLRTVRAPRYTQRLRDDVDAVYPPAKHDDIVNGLARLGMIDPGTNLADQFVTARLGQSAFVYNTNTDRLLLVMQDIPYDYLASNAPWVLARVLQDQHYDLDAVYETIHKHETAYPRQDDAALAARFVLDGEPTYLQFHWNIMQAGDADPMTPEVEDETLKTMSTVAGVQITLMTRPTLRRYAEMMKQGREEPVLAAMFDMGDGPFYVINPLYVAQNKGAYFISFLKRIGGWDDVARAYRELPVSTEQTLHPEKLFYEPDLPTTITLPEFVSLQKAGWTQVDSAVHGEYHLFNFFRRWQFDRFDSRLATTGWDGDVYQAWKSRAETYAFLLASTWDSEKDAQEFYKGYLRVLGMKYPAAQTNPEFTTARYTYDCGPAALEHGWLILRGREVFIIEGLPKDLGSKVLEELEAMTINYVE